MREQVETHPDPAARIAVVALRAAAAGRLAAGVVQHRFGSDARLLSSDELAQRLADLPKPLALRPAIDSDALHVYATSLDDSPLSRAHHEMLNDLPMRGGFFAFLSKRFQGSLDDLEVICEGNGESLRARVADVHRFERQYVFECPVSMGGDFVQDNRAVASISFAPGGGDWSMTGPGVEIHGVDWWTQPWPPPAA